MTVDTLVTLLSTSSSPGRNLRPPYEIETDAECQLGRGVQDILGHMQGKPWNKGYNEDGSC